MSTKLKIILLAQVIENKISESGKKQNQTHGPEPDSPLTF
jgi:hypothetical protein